MSRQEPRTAAHTVRMPAAAMDIVDDLAESEDRPYAQVIADAVKLYKLYSEITAKGGRLQYVTRGSRRHDVRILL